MIGIRKLAYPYPYIPVEKRPDVLPGHNICSIAPADDPDDVFITGNGSTTIRAAGQPYDEEMSYTHERLYTVQWEKTPLPPDLGGCMPQIRQLLLEGRADETCALIDEAQKKAGFDQYMNFDRKIVYPTGSPRQHTAFWLTFRKPKQPGTRDYLRWLNLQNGEITAVWTDCRGTFKSECFAAYEGDIAVNRFTAPKGKLDMEIGIQLPDRPVRLGAFVYEMPFEKCSHELSVTDSLITLSWAYNPEYGKKGFVAAIRLIPEGGSIRATGESIRLEGADSLVIVSRIVRFEENFSSACAESVKTDLMDMHVDVDRLLAQNEQHISSRMDRSRIHLGKAEDNWLSGEELLQKSHSEEVLCPALLEKLYDMGRFFQIYETGTLPPAVGQHNINTNLQVCAGNNTGLFDEMDVYFRFYESKFGDFRINAKRLFGARGLLASVHCDPDSGLFYHFSHTYPHYCWTGCLGWIYNELWGYYLVTGDEEFLRNRVIPAYKEMALFFEDYACDRDKDGKAIFYPSFSPENPTPNPGYETVTCSDINPTRVNSVMDIAICREILTNLIEGCRILGIEEEHIPHWKAQLDSLPVYLLDREGGLKEWAWERIEENYNHRHVSHHYDVWPGRAVTPETEPELAKAILISNRKRGQQDDSAHGIIHRAFTAIRLKDEEEAVQNLSQLLAHGFVRRTLQTSHFPYRGIFPDLQGAVPALLIEMCVFSAPGIIEFLPVMPADLAEGSIDGVWLYTFAKLEHMSWSRQAVHAVIVSRMDQTLTLRCRRQGSRMRINGKDAVMDGDHTECFFAAGETVDVDVFY